MRSPRALRPGGGCCGVLAAGQGHQRVLTLSVHTATPSPARVPPRRELGGTLPHSRILDREGRGGPKAGSPGLQALGELVEQGSAPAAAEEPSRGVLPSELQRRPPQAIHSGPCPWPSPASPEASTLRPRLWALLSMDKSKAVPCEGWRPAGLLWHSCTQCPAAPMCARGPLLSPGQSRLPTPRVHPSLPFLQARLSHRHSDIPKAYF